jgi:hypothetical protein
MGLYVIAVGNVFDGIGLYGPFDFADQANEYADLEFRGQEWNVVPVEPITSN